MNKLIFESKGLSKTHRIVMFVTPVVVLLCGILFIVLSGAKHSGTTIYNYTTGYSGTIGGGYVLEEEAREMFKMIGIVLCALPVVFAYGGYKSNQSYIKVYEDHVEGCQNGLAAKSFNLKYSQISHIDPPSAASSIVTPSVTIVAGGDKYVCMVEGAKRVHEEISARLR